MDGLTMTQDWLSR